MTDETEVNLGWDEQESTGGTDVTPKYDPILESQRNGSLAQAFTMLQRIFVEDGKVDVENERVVFMTAQFAAQVYHMLLKDDFYKQFGLTALELKEESVYIYVK